MEHPQDSMPGVFVATASIFRHRIDSSPARGTVYIAPSGRRCTFQYQKGDDLTFRYVGKDDVFGISMHNFVVLMVAE